MGAVQDEEDGVITIKVIAPETHPFKAGDEIVLEYLWYWKDVVRYVSDTETNIQILNSK